MHHLQLKSDLLTETTFKGSLCSLVTRSQTMTSSAHILAIFWLFASRNSYSSVKIQSDFLGKTLKHIFMSDDSFPTSSLKRLSLFILTTEIRM